MATRITRKQLLDTTVVPETPAPPPPAIGDNSGQPPTVLPTVAEVHASIEATLVAIVDSEKTIDYARQKLAHLLFERHAQKTAADDKTPAAALIAENQAMFDIYLTDLCTEFSLADPVKLASMDEISRSRYGNRLRGRLGRALRLFVNLAWLKQERPDENCTWDADAGRWNLSPFAFLPVDHTASGALLLKPGTKETRAYIPLENIEAAEYYFVQKGKSGNVSINVSLDQLEHAISTHIQRKRNPLSVSPEATPARQRRAARQPNAAKDADSNGPDIAMEDSDTPEATAPSGQTDRAWALGQLMRLLVSVEKILEHDTLADLRWSDLDKAGTNAMRAVEMVIDRMNAKPDGKVVAPGMPAKPAKAA